MVVTATIDALLVHHLLLAAMGRQRLLRRNSNALHVPLPNLLSQKKVFASTSRHGRRRSEVVLAAASRSLVLALAFEVCSILWSLVWKVALLNVLIKSLTTP